MTTHLFFENSENYIDFKVLEKSLNLIKNLNQIKENDEIKISKKYHLDLLWDCKSSKIEVKNNVEKIRLFSDRCFFSSQNIKSIENISNKFTATIFDLSNKNFTTDYINLNKEENLLKITFKNNNATKFINISKRL